MIYKPSKEELKRIENLNKSYALLEKALKLIKDNIPKKDSDIELCMYRMVKNHAKIMKKSAKLLEMDYIDKEFDNIIKISKNKKGKRIKDKDK